MATKEPKDQKRVLVFRVEPSVSSVPIIAGATCSIMAAVLLASGHAKDEDEAVNQAASLWGEVAERFKGYMDTLSEASARAKPTKS